MKKFLVVAMVTLFLISGSAVIFSASGSDTAARKEIKYITEFNPDVKSVELKFPDGGGSDSSLNITVPKRSKVLAATVDVEGLPKLNEYVYDFNDKENTSAWEGELGSIPPGSSPTEYDDTELDSREIDYIKKVDIDMAYYYYGEGSTGNSSTTGRPYHMFRFIVTDADASSFNFYWTGEGYARTGTGSINEVYIYIFNAQTNKWSQIDYQTKSSQGNVKLQSDVDTSSAATYIDSNSSVYYMVVGPSVTLGVTKGYISTDYVKLTVLAGNEIFPSGLALDLGADGTNDWTHPSTLNTKVTLDDGIGLKGKVQSLIDAQGTDAGTFPLTFKFTAGSEGRLLISNLNISLEALEHNEAPVEVPTKLVLFTMEEDNLTSGDDLVDLSDCFQDDHDSSDSLKYEVVFQEDPVKLEAVLDIDGYHLDFTPAENFYGTLLFRVNATDSGADEVFDTFDDLTTQSNLFQVKVLPVNDPPTVVLPQDPLAVDEGEKLKFNITADDPDDSQFEWSTNLTEKIKITIDEKNKHRAFVELSPSLADAGTTLYFQLSARDNGGGQGPASRAVGTTDVEVEVVNLNDPPKFVEFTILPDVYTEALVAGATVEKLDEKYWPAEDEEYLIGLTVKDPDLGIDPDEKLTFSLTPPEELAGTMDIDPATGEISFTPANGDVGTVEFTVTVTDNYDESAEQEFLLKVKNRNDPPGEPEILEPEGREFTTNDTITFKGQCTDDDLDIEDSDETLTFLWFSNHTAQPLGMGEELGGVKLTEGWHKITLQVRDTMSEVSETSIVIFVEKFAVDDVPGDDDDKPGDDDTPGDGDTPPGGSSTDDKGAGTVMMAALAIIIIIVVIIAFVGFMKFRGKKKLEDDEDETASMERTMVPGPMGFPVMPGMQAGYPQQPQYGQYMQPQMQYGMTARPVMQQPMQFGYQQQQVPQLPAAQVVPQAAQPQPAVIPQAKTYDPTAISVEAQTPTAEQMQQVDPGTLEKTKPVDNE